MTGTGFTMEGGVWNRGGGRERAAATVVELGWRLGLDFEVKLAWRCMGRCTQAYIGVWEESRWIKIRVRDKI
jgi:hypothetical protein